MASVLSEEGSGTSRSLNMDTTDRVLEPQNRCDDATTIVRRRYKKLRQRNRLSGKLLLNNNLQEKNRLLLVAASMLFKCSKHPSNFRTDKLTK